MTSLFGLKCKPTPATADAVWDHARELVRRGPPFEPGEANTLAAAYRYGVERPIQDGLDVLTMQTCARFPRPPRSVVAKGPSPFDAAIAAAEIELEAVRVRELAARAECHRLQDRARGCAQRTAKWEAVMAELEGALEAHRAVDQEWVRAKSRLGSLGLSRDRWRADQDA